MEAGDGKIIALKVKVLQNILEQLKIPFAGDFVECDNIWLASTASTPNKRPLPAAAMYEVKDENRMAGMAQIFVQDFARQVAAISERVVGNYWLQKIIPVSMTEICPIINLDFGPYKLNGIDILEGFAKFQEASLFRAVDIN